MFSFFNHQEELRRQRVNSRNKIIIFSFISATISAITAWIFSSKENREYVTNQSKKASEEVQKFGKKFGTQASQKAKEINKMISEEFAKISDRVAENLERSNLKKNKEENNKPSKTNPAKAENYLEEDDKK